MRLPLLALLVSVAAAGAASGQTPAPPPDSIERFVATLETVAGAGDRDALFALSATRDDAGVQDFSYAIVPTPARVVIKERDRAQLEDGSWRLLLEMLAERGSEARLSTWRIDLKPAAAATETESPDPSRPAAEWRIGKMDRLTVVSGLYRLALDPSRQFDVRDLTIVAPDLELHMPSGTAFVAESVEGPTAVVLLGRGRIKLAPEDPAERTQIRIFAGGEALDTEFDALFVRVKPSEFTARFRRESLVARELSAADLRRATEVFDEYVGRTLQVDLGDLSRDRWSIVPSTGDLIAEVRTRRHGTLTYARTWNDAEDVSFFDRRRRRNITVYASTEKRAARGRFYSEDDLVDYDILSYDIDAAFTPERLWVSGTTRMTLKVRAVQLTTMTLRLAESLTVRAVHSPELGRLLHLRVVNQNSLIVNLPAALPRETEFTLAISYTGRVDPQELEREAIAVAQEQEIVQIPLEPRYIYSNRSYWYPQGNVTDYATARLRITVPPEYDVIASGTPAGEAAPAPGPVAPGERPRKLFVFESEQPVRYVGVVISRFATVTTAELNLSSADLSAGGPDGGDAAEANELSLIVRANPRQAGRARALSQKSAEIIQFYASLVGEAPYPSFTLAVTESDLPGGHSPAYFAILNQPLLMSQVTWRNDPVAFDNYPSFFIAHELAHQWWGQAVGWKNYHEQWISEGFSQYFAALFAEKERGAGVLLNLLRQMRRTGMAASDQGPIYLGYRLGHIRSDSRVFRALVYNKAAMVLHMLRRTIGDEAFFSGVRSFYASWKFRKAGTDDFRRAMEEASRRDLSSFFEGWIYGSAIPRVKFSHRASGDSLLLRFEHKGEVVPVPITVSVTYASGESEELVVAVTERVVERLVSARGAVRRVDVNEDSAALAHVDK